MSASPNSFLPPLSPKATPQDDEAVESINQLKRTYASLDVSTGQEIPEGYEAEDDEIPDLAYYFSGFQMTYDEQVRICRTYASYLAAQQPKRKK